MAKLLKLRRGSTTQHSSFTGAEGEVTVDTTKDVLVVNDGSTQGGHPLAAEDMSNVSSASIENKISSLAGSKVDPNFGSQNVQTTGTLASGAHTVTGNISVSGTVDGRDVASDGAKIDQLHGGTNTLKATVGLANGVTAVTQSAGDASTKVATTAYTDTAISNLVDSSPSALNTLNELAAALGDDANFSTTVTNSIATKLDTNGNGSSLTNLNADNISSGTISASRVPTLNQNTTGNAATATALANARNIAGVSFDGTASISLDNSNITNGAGYTTYTSNQATDTNSNVTFGTVNCSSLTSSGNVTAFSDRRLKENIAVVPNALDKVQAINGVSFDWKKTGEKSAGVIAQEVQSVLPEAVKEITPIGGGDSHLAVNYHALISILIESIKELKARVEQLEGGK